MSPVGKLVEVEAIRAAKTAEHREQEPFPPSDYPDPTCTDCDRNGVIVVYCATDDRSCPQHPKCGGVREMQVHKTARGMGGGWVTQEPLARPAVAREGERAERSTAPESSRKAWTLSPG
jgi:hypothetical protein